MSQSSLSFDKVLYLNTNASILAIGSGKSSDQSAPIEYNTTFCLVSAINSSFDQCLIWDGDRLRDEFGSTSLITLCNSSLSPSVSPGVPTSSTDSPPSTMFPSTFEPSTVISSNTTPSTTLPSTSVPPTTLSSTSVESSTIIPSTITPFTTLPTVEPTTISPSTNIPSSPSPSTSAPITTSPITSIPSSTIPTDSPNCLYNVPDCENCGRQGIIFDSSQFNISCILVGNTWSYSFSNKFSNITTISESAILNGTSVVIQGDFNQTSNSTITIVISPSNNNNLAERGIPLTVNGCVTLNGNISLVLEQKPQNGNTSILLLNYNCTQTLNFSSSQFTVKPTYRNNKCDRIGSTLNSKQNTLSVSLSSTLGSNCKGLSTGAIVGIVIGAVGGSILIILIS
eukprot:TRINITY_DN1307_c0_g1_i1.p1 TRINITY_DN1307_c0_g1~~TRINITY_DN1307_c0_g1_i1.p1  ORF type:complete len:397 (-),score=80.29 TRINITY_DN1307_c0_g1_i1:127-1317(-)